MIFESEIRQTSLVTLTLSTDNVRFLINRANGIILGCAIDNFESFSGSGELTCLIQSQGAVEAMFTVSISIYLCFHDIL